MPAKVYSAMSLGLSPYVIEVELDLSRGLKSFSIVGLPDKAVAEAKDRISAAIKNSGFESPLKGNHKVIVSLAPADLPKEGSAFDLAIALSYMLSSGELRFEPSGKLFLGELGLDGEVRAVRGVLPLTKLAKERGFGEIYVPKSNAREAALVSGIDVYAIENLRQVVSHLDLNSGDNRDKLVKEAKTNPGDKESGEELSVEVDLSDVHGQESAKRALEIAAAGRHNIALIGPPGTGKSMLAKAFIGILPPLSEEELLETTAIHSVSGKLDTRHLTTPPLRSPHHTSSYVAICGGGVVPRPGEISLAHNGVLFLDELPEFDRKVLESLRQPLEDGVINISRASGSERFPANIILLATMNPCPCGKLGSNKACVCSQAVVDRYRRKISGPIVDRIDLWVTVGAVDLDKLSKHKSGESAAEVKARVRAARGVQRWRFNKKALNTNADMSAKDIAEFIHLDKFCRKILHQTAERLGLSGRGYHRVLKVARTIADLGGSENIKESHILEALQYRPRTDFLV